MLVKRLNKTGSNDLNVVYRPCRIDEFIGNNINKNIIKKGLDSNELPHTLLFVGEAGCGKTTAARIIALGLNCENSYGPTSNPCLECDSCLSILEQRSIDVVEINVGKEGGKADIESIINSLSSAPFSLRKKVIIFDEAHKLTDAAKDLLLKPIEDGFSHVYYIFCTNHPEKLKSKNSKEGEAFLDRCTILNFTTISEEELVDMLKNVCEFEGVVFNYDILKLIATESGGVPRRALVWLNQVIHEGSWKKEVVVEIIGTIGEEEDVQIIELARLLKQGEFKKSCAVYEKIKNKGAEYVRIVVSSFFISCLKNASKFNDAVIFSNVLDILLKPIYETGKVGDMVMYNVMFKVTNVIRDSKKGR